MPKHDEAGRQIAGLLGYNPGPGIYSRLERAVQQMPANVRVEELPGLIKRYKEGVPGWELRATDLDSVIAGRDVVPRDELLARVQQTSPVYTHKEVVLAENPPTREIEQYDLESGKHVYAPMPVYQDEASRLGEGVAHGDPKYPGYGHGGSDYKELLLTQPGAGKHQYENHWTGAATNYTNANEDAVAHARFDTHGDALRINELQSDLGIYNRQMREAAGSSPTPQLPYQDDPEYIAQLVYVFRWQNQQSDNANADFQLEMYDRHTAAKMAGIQECAALPTGLIMYDMRAFELTEPKTDADKPWFYYEWSDRYAAHKASTEDVTMTRDLSLIGTQRLGYNPVFCNWDAWAGHWKPKCVGKPVVISASGVSAKLREEWAAGVEPGVKLIDLRPKHKWTVTPVKLP